MTTVHGFHAHIYFDASEKEAAQALARKAHERFGIRVGRFHDSPVGPHPRGSCQLTVPCAQFGDVAAWLATNRNGLTIFAHADTGDDLTDHTANVIWFGPSEALDISQFEPTP